jgi:hypothetical protein
VCLSEHDETHDVTVLVENDQQEPLFERESALRCERGPRGATFPAPTDPATAVVTVDMTRFDYQWPGFEADELPCEGENRPGLEVYPRVLVALVASDLTDATADDEQTLHSVERWRAARGDIRGQMYCANSTGLHGSHTTARAPFVPQYSRNKRVTRDNSRSLSQATSAESCI